MSNIETFLSKIETFVKNRKCLSKIGNFCQKSDSFAKHRKLIFDIKNRNFCQKSEILSHIETFVKNQKFGQNAKFELKLVTFLWIYLYFWNFAFCQQNNNSFKHKFWVLAKLLIFDPISVLWQMFRFLTKVSTFEQKLDF